MVRTCLRVEVALLAALARRAAAAADGEIAAGLVRRSPGSGGRGGGHRAGGGLRGGGAHPPQHPRPGERAQAAGAREVRPSCTSGRPRSTCWTPRTPARSAPRCGACSCRCSLDLEVELLASGGARGGHAADRPHARPARRADHLRLRHGRVRLAGSGGRIQAIARSAGELRGKLAGAVGAYNAHASLRRPRGVRSGGASPSLDLRPPSTPRRSSSRSTCLRLVLRDQSGLRRARQPRRRHAAPAAHRDRRGGRGVRGGAGRLLDHAAQAQPVELREREEHVEGLHAAHASRSTWTRSPSTSAT